MEKWVEALARLSCRSREKKKGSGGWASVQAGPLGKIRK